jgi:ABC-type transporter Mla maintaining outer membrane lipid asymmetry permease subunit MlaE
VPITASSRWTLVSDGVGILTIGVQLYLLVSWLVPHGSRTILGIIAYIVIAGVALYLWHKEPPVKKLSEPSEWARAIVASFVMGGVSFSIDMIVGLMHNSSLPPIEAGTRAGSLFGFPLTVMLCPGFTMVAIAGLLRALVLRSGATPTSQS